MRLEDLERELRAERPDVDPEFARKLDEWAEAGFPRGSSRDPRSLRARKERGFQARLERAWERLTSVPPRRLIAPVGAVAVLAVVVGVGVSQVDLGGSGELASSGGDDDGSAQVENQRLDELNAAGDQAAPPVAAEDAGAGDAGGPPVQPAASGEAVRTDRDSEYAIGLPAAGAAGQAVAPAPNGGDGVARGTDERIEDRTARLSLGAEADEVQEVANGVIEVTDRHDGIVLSSQVTSDQGGARASFELEIPVTELDATMADLSELADVISRTEASEDITQPFVRAQKERARILDQIQKLRIDLIQADTREERLVIKSQINSLEAQADAFEAQANSVERRGRFATLAVNVTSNGPDSDDGWSLGDAVDDAGDVLRTVAGIGLVSLAVLLPVALIGALAFWMGSSARRRNRERALDT